MCDICPQVENISTHIEFYIDIDNSGVASLCITV